jgi:hypothetical protein
MKAPFVYTCPGTGPPFTLIAATFGPAPDGTTVMRTTAVTVESATEVAVTIAVTGDETMLGAV